MKGFTEQHEVILLRHASLYESLVTAGFMRNIENSIFDELIGVYHETIGMHHFSNWCSSCVVDMVNQLYKNYYEWKKGQSEPDEPVINEPVDMEQKTTNPSNYKRKRR